MTATQRIVFTCLVGLVVALLLVGVVSGTVLRHVVQIAPAVAALVLVARRPALGAYAAVPVFAFWLCIVALIWLFLLGLSRIASGHYTLAEIVATVLMAGFSAAGIRKSVTLGNTLPLSARALAIVIFGALQVGVMWVSLLPQIAHR